SAVNGHQWKPFHWCPFAIPRPSGGSRRFYYHPSHSFLQVLHLYVVSTSTRSSAILFRCLLSGHMTVTEPFTKHWSPHFSHLCCFVPRVPMSTCPFVGHLTCHFPYSACRSSAVAGLPTPKSSTSPHAPANRMNPRRVPTSEGFMTISSSVSCRRAT